MKYLIVLLAALALATSTHAAPTKESFDELLRAADAQSVLDSQAQKLDALLEDQFDRVLTNRETPEGVAYGEAFRQKVQARLREKITMADLAADSFKETGGEWTQAEVDALVKLCAQPAGRSALAKLAPTIRNFEGLVQKHMIQFRLETAQSLRAALQELKEINTKALAAGSPAPVTQAGAVESPSKPTSAAPASAVAARP